MNKQFEYYFLGTLSLGVLLNYLFLETPRIIYKGKNKFTTKLNSKCYNNSSEEITCLH